MQTDGTLFDFLRIAGTEVAVSASRHASADVSLECGDTLVVRRLIAEEKAAHFDSLRLLNDSPVWGPVVRSLAFLSGKTELALLLTVQTTRPSGILGHWDTSKS